MGLKVEMDRESIIRSIKLIGAHAKAAAFDELKKEARIIRDLARDFAPIDEGDLESAIITQVDRAEKTVYIGIDPSATDDRGLPINSYGALMHEGLAPYGSGYYKLGKRSVAKGGDVGGKFLTRAWSERKDRIMDRVARAVKKGVRKK